MEEQTKIDPDEYKENIEHEANSISGDTVQLEILNILRDTQTEMEAMKNNNNNHNNKNNWKNNNNNNNNNDNNNNDTSWRNIYC